MATIDFFGAQQAAHRRTQWLVLAFLLILSVLATIFYAIAVFLLGQQPPPGPGEAPMITGWWQPEIFLWVAAGTFAIIGGASLWKTASLRGGGGRVAESLGGMEVNPNTSDPKERQLLNVVEEMAIASGTPMPKVYILPEEGINAFAAGYKLEDAAVAVTRGALHELSRDELQGVMAHEFSHILNADMRLNIRLMAIVFGLFMVTMVGRIIMRAAFFSGGGGNNRKGGAVPILLLALAMVVLGFIGMIFGRIMQSAISRQREFLADASAVQFTRNPDGISGALRRIGGFKAGARVRHPESEDAAHFFFAHALGSGLSGLFATHPPLKERIRRLQPAAAETTAEKTRQTAASGRGAAEAVGARGFAGSSARVAPAPEVPGAVTPEAVMAARTLLSRVPDGLKAAARHPLHARAAIFALLLDAHDPGLRERQEKWLREEAGTELARVLNDYGEAVAELDPAARRALLEMALSALTGFTAVEYGLFRKRVDRLIRFDAKVDLFEFFLGRLVEQRLGARFGDRKPVGRLTVATAREPMGRVLSALVAVDERSPTERSEAWAAARSLVPLPAKPLDVSAEDGPIDFTQLGEDLDQLRGLPPRLRARLLNAARQIVVAGDGTVSLRENELLRAIAAGLEAPLPLGIPA